MSTTECPKCLNQAGFVFGTCNECGWNHVENKYTWITVYLTELHSSEDLTEYLVNRHDHSVSMTRRSRENWKKKGL